MNLIKCSSVALAISLSISFVQVLAKDLDELKIKVSTTPSIAGKVPENIDSATPGLMPTKPLEDIPDDIMDIINTLPKAKSDFIKSGKSSGVLKKDILFDLISSASTDETEEYVDTIMSIYDQMEFKKGRDIEAIELNKSSPNFNSWRLKRPQSMNPDREPGPISLGRYIGGGRSGIPTFANAPVALTPEDLIAGEVDVAILGAPLDMGSGWRDAIHGPRAMRMLRRGTGGTDVSTLINPSSVLNIVDYGNVAIDQLSTERSVQEVRKMVREIAETGAIPIIIGGDHSLEYPNVAAMADVYGKGKVAVVHFD
ncbi:MAG: arginase family protein, partial [Sinobacterium sp.]